MSVTRMCLFVGQFRQSTPYFLSAIKPRILSRFTPKNYQPRCFCTDHESSGHGQVKIKVHLENEVNTIIEEKSRYILDELKSRGSDGGAAIKQIHIEKRFRVLYDNGVSLEKIGAQFIETPDILFAHPRRLDEIFHFFREVGFESNVTWRNIVLCPELLRMPQTKLYKNYMAYAMFHIGDVSLAKLINKLPVMYLENPAVIIGQVQWLLKTFPPMETVNLLRNCPAVLTIPSQDTMDKIIYINTEIGLDQEHIADSQVLEKSMVFIVTRVEFLRRLGVLVYRDMKKDRTSYRAGLSINDIFDTSNKDFVYKIAKSTSEEYETFTRLLEEEESLKEDEVSNEDEEALIQTFTEQSHRKKKYKR